MDLGASASFVAEPREPSVFHRAPRNPKDPFLDRPMIYGIAAGSLALFASVFVPYVYTLTTLQSASAQAAAFAAWMIGHILLAFVLRSEHDPLVRIGLFSNRVMILWALGALALLAAAMLVPSLGGRIGLAPLPASIWTAVIGVSIVCIGWLEAAKWVRGFGAPGKSTT
jgi:Ca2+-transporting ATPase